ncbi:glucokinase [Paucidesulfovibrio longus]|uniref:glucokinase n=1 Tax=Paucidesulfovibrio longus TaxID=889 RepID=UPI0003B651AF|nr:glucokinase [Paucidesulfovibrio longus]
MSEIFVADIGGTNSRFALFHSGSGRLEMRERLEFPTGESDSFQELLERCVRSLLPALPKRLDMSVFAVPGAVVDACRCEPPNIDWDIDLRRDLASAAEAAGGLGLFPESRVRMVNDFVAQAFSTRTRCADAAETVQAGVPRPGRTVAVLGAGTGLGHCALVPDNGVLVAVASEAGHAAFPFSGPEEREFEAFARKRLGVGYCCQEHVVSGSGLALVHEFLSLERLAPVEVAARLDEHPRTVRWFARFYGRAARQYVLTVMAAGGLWLSGGVAVKNPHLVLAPSFLEEFLDCPGFGALLGEVPVRLLVGEDNGLFGAAYYGLQELNRLERGTG